MHQIFRSTFFNFEFLRVLGAAPYQGAEVGECLETASQIKDGDPESWYHAWFGRAEKTLMLAREAAARGDRAATSWAYIRASNYFRASEFLLHCNPSDPRILPAALASVDAFDRGCEALDATVIALSIPYDDGNLLPARLYLPPTAARVSNKLPVLLNTGGFDSTNEELYFYGAAAALPRGYAVLSFDGPGQGLALRRDGLSLRPDWEHVTSAVLDFLFSRLALDHPDLDLERIAILGASLGGYLALRSAADPRIAAVVSCDGCYDMFDVTRSRMPSWFINGWLSGWISDGVFNWVVDRLASGNFQLRWEFGHSQWVYGVDTPADVMRAMQRFSLKGYLGQLQCAVMVTGATDSFYFTPPLNACRIFEDIGHLNTSRRELWLGEGVDGGGLQAKIAALGLMHQKMFAWLDGQFDIKR